MPNFEAIKKTSNNYQVINDNTNDLDIPDFGDVKVEKKLK